MGVDGPWRVAVGGIASPAPGQRSLDFHNIPAHTAAMRKRVQIALAVVIVAVLAVLGWEILLSREPEPVVDGKPLASWLDYYVGTRSEVQREMADQALDKVGTNAIPVMLLMLRQKDSPFKRKLMEVIQKQGFIKLPYIPAERRNQAAYFAFLKLGARAESAVPALIQIFELNISAFSQQCTAGSLASVGPAANVAIPVLVRGLTNANPLVRQDIVTSLGRLHSEPELVVPALTKALNDPVARVRSSACLALWRVGAGAKQAVPALVKALNDSDPSVTSVAALALRQIDVEAAAKAGVK
jgi:hypothetical protein